MIEPGLGVVLKRIVCFPAFNHHVFFACDKDFLDAFKVVFYFFKVLPVVVEQGFGIFYNAC